MTPLLTPVNFRWTIPLTAHIFTGFTTPVTSRWTLLLSLRQEGEYQQSNQPFRGEIHTTIIGYKCNCSVVDICLVLVITVIQIVKGWFAVGAILIIKEGEK